MNEKSLKLRKELESFKQSTGKLSSKINEVNDVWNDDNYAMLQTRIIELSKQTKTVIVNGDRACVDIDKFFSIADEPV